MINLKYVNLVWSLIAIVSIVDALFAAGPATISYQGRLTDPSGVPLNGNFQVAFAVYPDSLTPFASWQETHQITCTDGLFNVVLGRTTAFPYYTFTDSAAFLGIKIGSDPELFPRKRLNSTPFAMRVGSVDGAIGGVINGELWVANYGNGERAINCDGGSRGGTFRAWDNAYDATAVTGRYAGSYPVDAKGVKGESIPSDGYGIGGDFTGGWYGIEARSEIPDYSSFGHSGVVGRAEGYAGSSSHHGLYGSAGGGKYNYGVEGYAYHNGTPGANAFGVYGSATFFDGNGAWAGYFNGWTTCNGTLEVMGTLYKPAGSFRIDHPLDPENKFLQHSFVESPDMKNIYDGNVTTDANGDAVVTMPEWFSALNRDFRYQLTVIGQFAQAIVAKKLEGNSFSIRTDKPNVEVSWQLTGIRQDAYANAHRIEVEVDKKPQERGRYIDPLAFGKAPEKQLHYEITKAAEDDRIANEARSKANALKRSAVADSLWPVSTKR